MNWILWTSLVTRLAAIVATQNGAAPRELAYLSLITTATEAFNLTDQDLTALKEKYEQEAAAGAPVTADELDEIAARINARSERIQNA